MRYAHSCAGEGQRPPASSSLPRYALCAWFDAGSPDRLRSSYLAFATAFLGLPLVASSCSHEEVRAAIRRWLNGHNSYLLVFDDVRAFSDIEAFLPSFTPPPSTASHPLCSPRRDVLITSRRTQLPSSSHALEVRLEEVMTADESVQLLVQLMGRVRADVEPYLHSAEYAQLAAALHHRPLSLNLAGACLSQQPHMSLHAYAQQLSQLPTEHAGQPVARDAGVRALLFAVHSMAQVYKADGVQPLVLSLLLACCYLHSDGIPVTALEEWLKAEQRGRVAAAPHLSQSTASLLQTLEGYSLLQFAEAKQEVRLSRALQSVVRRLHGVDRPLDDSLLLAGRIGCIPRVVQSSLQRHRCTFEVTHHTGEMQLWYGCAQCAPQSPSQASSAVAEPSDPPSLGCCLSCANSCHAGHTLSGPYFSPFYCDCGANGLAHPCGLLREHAQRSEPGEAAASSSESFELHIPVVLDNHQDRHESGGVHPAAAASALLGRLSLSWYLRLMKATVVACLFHRAREPRSLTVMSSYASHLNTLQRRYYQHLAPLLRAAGKPCPDEVVYALLLLGESRRDLPAQPPLPASAAAQPDAVPPTSAKAALLQCLAEYEQLPHLHRLPDFHVLFVCLAFVSNDGGRYEEVVSFCERANTLRAALPPGTVPALTHAHVLCAQAEALGRLNRRREELKVCEELLALSREHLSSDEWYGHEFGLPACMYRMATAYSWAARLAESTQLLTSAVQLCEAYRCRVGDAAMPAQLLRLLVNVRAGLSLQSADVDNLDALQQQLRSEQSLHGSESRQCATIWAAITAHHVQAGSYKLAVESGTELIRVMEQLQGEAVRRELVHAWQLLGNVHRQWQHHQLAVAAYRRAVDIGLAERLASVDAQRVAHVQSSLADCELQLGHADEAVLSFDAALREFEQAQPNTARLALLRWSQAVALRRGGREPERQLQLLRGAAAIFEQLHDGREQQVRALLRQVEQQ